LDVALAGTVYQHERRGAGAKIIEQTEWSKADGAGVVCAAGDAIADIAQNLAVEPL
jgi:hypothetical protein